MFSQEVRRKIFHDFLASHIGQSESSKSRLTLEPTHSLNRTLISKEIFFPPPFCSETFKKRHLPQLELKSLWQITAVLGGLAAYLSSGYLGIQYGSTTQSDQRTDFKRRETAAAKTSWTKKKKNWEGTQDKRNRISSVFRQQKHHWHTESCWRCRTEVHLTRAFSFFLFCF